MVSGLRIEGGTQVFPARVRKTIQSIKEIVGDHLDADIYTALKENNMDPNETTQKLLNQDPFHEVKRKKDKKKENMWYKSFVDPQRHYEDMAQGTKFHTLPDRNGRRMGYSRNALPAINREFRIVRDNRVNRNTNREVHPASLQVSTSNSERLPSNAPKKSPTGTLGGQRPSGGLIPSQAPHGPTDSHTRNVRDGYIAVTGRKEISDAKRVMVPNSASNVEAVKPKHSQDNSEIRELNSSAVGVYSSATDPVHVPSPDSRSSAPVGAIKREVGVVGVRRQSSGSTNQSSGPGGSFSNSLVGRESSSTESFRPLIPVSNADQSSQSTESVMPNIVGSRAFLNNQHGRQQQHLGHQKASQPNKEWKPKSSQKSSNNPGVIGTPKNSISPPADEPKNLTPEEANLQDKLSRVNIYENQNVIIAQHIRVPETDCCRLTFGSFGKNSDLSRTVVSGSQVVGAPEVSNREPTEAARCLSVPAPVSSADDTIVRKQSDFPDDQVRNSGSDSPASGATSELQLADKRESSSPPHLDNYADIGLVRERSPTYAPDSQYQNPPELSGLSAYDPQTAYEMPYFRPTVDEAVRVQGLLSPQDTLSTHGSNSIPASTYAMVQQQQQQQQQVAQMYPHVHLSHFANLMPYRQFLSPVYVPPMAMPGYSSNPAYPHPSSGNSYLLMPGGSSHLSANNLKYGMQQFKPVPAGSPTGFGNFNNPAGYAINAQSVVGGATGLEDSSRIKYKDGNLYVPNPQAETSEIWIQNPREVQGLQSGPYYNMQGQTPHGTYLQSHTGHASFNAAASQSSHMQFPGMYHPSQQPAAMASAHHLGPGLGSNIGGGVAAGAPGPQVGAYQSPQLGHLSWTTNF